MYQLGEENSEFVKPITIHVNGKMKRNMFGSRTFEGIIDIEDDEIPVPKDRRELILKLGQSGQLEQADLTYRNFEYGSPRSFSYGSIFVNHDFSKISIQKYKIEEISPNPSRGYWNSVDGYMISAPARTREEVLQISNDLKNVYMHLQKAPFN